MRRSKAMRSADSEPSERLRQAEADAFDELSTPDDEAWDIVRVECPDCRRPIALLADEDVLPEHAMCPTPWNPFVLSVCSGSGRSVEDAAPSQDAEANDQDMAVLLTLPEGLDWRRQPFSHAGGPGSRPMRMKQRKAS